MLRIDCYTPQSQLLLHSSILTIGLTSTAVAETPLALDELDAIPVVLTPSRIEQPFNESPTEVTIIDSRKIKASGS